MLDCGLIFKKTSTCYKNPDIEYLDETSDYKLHIKSKREGIAIEVLKAQNGQVQKSISYLTKEEHGKVYAGGFLRDALLQKKALAPEKWNNTHRKKAITSAIFKHVRKYGAFRGTMGHKLVFSVSKELEEKVNEAGLNLDRVLAKEVKKVMFEFQKKFYPGEKLGYAWGIHHDTDNRHIHIYLCNRTASGKNVAMSCALKGKHKKHIQKDYLGFMIERTKKAKDRILNQIKKVNINQSRPKPEEVVLKPAPVVNYDQKFQEREETLQAMREKLVAQKNLINLRKEQIRRLCNQSRIHSEMIRTGYEDIKAINKNLSTSFQKLKQTKSSIPISILLKLGFFAKSGPMKKLALILNRLQFTKQKEQREKLFQIISLNKSQKAYLLQSLESLQENRQQFKQKNLELKEKKKALQKQFYSDLSDYERKLERFKEDFYMAHVKSSANKENYLKLRKALGFKRKNGLDPSEELRNIRVMDSIVRKELESQKQSKTLPFDIQPSQEATPNNNGQDISL